MKKVLGINQYTGIESRSSVGNSDHPVVNGDEAPSIKEIHDIFMSDGVPLAVEETVYFVPILTKFSLLF